MCIRDSVRTPESKKRSLWLTLSLLAFAFGLMAKQMLVTLPFVLLLIDFWPLERLRTTKPARLVLEKLPFAVLAAVASVVIYLVQESGGSVTEGVTPGARLTN